MLKCDEGHQMVQVASQCTVGTKSNYVCEIPSREASGKKYNHWYKVLIC